MDYCEWETRAEVQGKEKYCEGNVKGIWINNWYKNQRNNPIKKKEEKKRVKMEILIF